MEGTCFEQRAVQNEGAQKIPVSERRGFNMMHPSQGCFSSIFQLYLCQLKQVDMTQHRVANKKLLLLQNDWEI